MADVTKIDTFIQSSPRPAWLVTTQGQCIYANPALERLTGLNSDQINRADWRSFLLEEDRAVASASWQRSLATGAPYRMQVRMRGSDGAPQSVELIAFGHKSGDDAELWLFTGLDVTGVAAPERTQFEAQLQATLNVLPAYTWYALPSGALTFVNERSADYLGLPKDHPLRFGIDMGAEWDSHISLLHPDDHEIARRAWATRLRTGCAGEVSFRVRSAEAGYRWFLSRAEPLRASDGTLLYWIGDNLDIDDAKRAEDALRKSEKESRDVIDTISATVWSALPDGSNTYVNKHFVEYSGVSAEQTAGSGWKAVIHPDDLERHAGKWMEAVATGKPHENEVRFRRSDGQYRWHLDRGVPLRDEDGNIVKWYGVVIDIEDRKQAEEALSVLSRDLQESKAKLEEAQRITHVGYWEWDPLTDRVNWSDETYRIYGMQPQERAMYLATVAEKIHPDDWNRALEQALGGAHINVECRLFRPTGEVRIAQFQGDVKRDASGQPTLRFGTVQDITDRKRAEERLRESEAYLAEAQRLSQTGSWAWNPVTGDIRYWSEMCFRLLGFDPAGPLPRFEEFVHRIHPDDQTVVRERFDKAIREKADFELDYRVEHPEKGIREIHVVGHAILDLSGNLNEFVGTVIDVTERKCAEEALQKSQVYLSEGQRLAHMGSWAFNPASFFDYWSEELFRIYGLDPQKGSPTLEQYLATIHPQDRDFMADTIKRMHAERTGCDVKNRIVRPDGEQRYIRCVGIPVVEGEVLKGFLGTAIDITEQELLTQELERRQAYLTEAQKLTHTASWAWRVSDRSAVYLSDEIYRIFGLDPADGSPNWEKRLALVHPDDRLAWKNTIERAIVEKVDYDHEFRILLPNGMMKWIHAVGHPVLSNTGDLEQFIGSSTDITERKSAEQERERLRQIEADLAHIGRVSTLGEMAASLAHEIKQPIAAAITSANSCIEWLAHQPPNLDRARAAAARIDKYGNRAAEIIDRIRALYKKSPPQRELVDVNGIIQEMLTLLNGEATRHSVAMGTELATELPKTMVDRVQLQQVFMNLMLNGIEAMKDSGGELTVKSELQDGQVQLSVSDTGIGLPAEKMDQIFSAFFTTKPQGSGMGLAISRSIVESHGGRLWATANDERGATFHFTLPTHMTEPSSQVNLMTLE
jgi:PAS domain S-box-containing protein